MLHAAWKRLSARLGARIGRAIGDERGAVAVQFAFLALPIAILTFGLVDVSRISVQRHQLQDALDAATLMAARSTASTDAAVDTIGDAALVAEMAGLGVTLTSASSTFKLGTDNRILGSVTVSMKPVIANLWTNGDVPVTATSEVVRASKNLEVALVLDITGSMSGTRIADLKTAASDMVDTLVRDTQTPFYSKVALVPYAMGVNVGSYAAAARGPVEGPKSISAAAWSNSTAKTISGISRANPAVVSATGHGFANGDYVYLSGISGMTTLNGKIFRVAGKTTNNFQLSGVDSTFYSKWTSGGKATRCVTASCTVVVTTSTAHDLQTGDLVTYAGLGGLTTLNGLTLPVTALSTTTLDTEQFGPTLSAYTSGGTVTCDTSATPGCIRFTFTSVDNTSVTFDISNCTSERTGANAYTDVAPSTAFVGRNYPAATNPCPSSTITPLSTDRTALKTQINDMVVGGSTAGQIGLAWGWYMVSPNFGYLWPSASQRPDVYGAKDLMKVVILMTDGAFNTPYCSDVIAADAGSGSGATGDHINCNATNGSAFTQAEALCNSIKAKNVVLYTVGFDVGTDATAKAMLTSCATDTAHVFFPATGSELKSTFKAIAQEISNLRISK